MCEAAEGFRKRKACKQLPMPRAALKAFQAEHASWGVLAGYTGS
jgi:hypothetical protein